MSFEDSNKENGSAPAHHEGCTCPKHEDGTLRTHIHVRDDCAIVRADLLAREDASREKRTSW